MKKVSIFVLSLVFVFTLSGCSIIQQFLPTGLIGSISGSGALFEDDFSKTSSGWDRWSGNEGSTDYVDDRYEIYVSPTEYTLWGNPGKNFTDVSVEVDAVMVSGPIDNDFGIICRYVDANNYYYGIVTSDGYYDIGSLVEGEWQYFSDSLAYSDAVNQEFESNHIRFDCVGSTLTLYANGTQLMQVTDSTFTSGDVGLTAGTYDTGGAQIAFDNFVVTKP